MDSHVEVNNAYYPVPPKYMGKQVVVHYNSKTVKVFYQNKCIQQLYTVEKGRFHPDKSCLPPQKSGSQNQYVQYLMKRCRQLGDSVYQWAKQAEAHRAQRAYRAIQGVVALSKKYPDHTIDAACRKAVQQNAFSYHIVQKQVEASVLQKEIQRELVFEQEHDIIRTLDEYKTLLSGGN
jgi:hypothetical protein